MKFLGHEEVPLKHLTGLPTGEQWQALCETYEVQQRALSIDRLTMLQEPGVRKRDLRVVWGTRRIAAHDVLGYAKVLVKMIDCDDEELEAIKIAENAEREHNQRWTGDALVQLVEFYERQEQLGGDLPMFQPLHRPKGGRPLTAQGKAVQVVSQITGRSKESLRAKIYREKGRAGKLAQVEMPKPETPDEGIIDTLGQELDPAFLLEIAAIRASLIGVQRYLKSAKARLAKLRSDKVAFPDAYIERLRSNLTDCFRRVGRVVPVSLCPYCLCGVRSDPKTCAACLGAGTVGKEVLENSSKELKSKVAEKREDNDDDRESDIPW